MGAVPAVHLLCQAALRVYEYSGVCLSRSCFSIWHVLGAKF